MKKSEREIIDAAVKNLESEISITNGRYCDDRIEEDLGRGAVLLERGQCTLIVCPNVLPICLKGNVNCIFCYNLLHEACFVPFHDEKL